MALRSGLVTDSHHLLRIINDMSSDDNLSNEDDNHPISLILVQYDTLTVTGRHDAPSPGLYHGGNMGSHVANPDS